jgi:hypothetical protein
MSKKIEKNVALVLQYGGLHRLGVHKQPEVLRAFIIELGPWESVLRTSRCSMSWGALWLSIGSLATLIDKELDASSVS